MTPEKSAIGALVSEEFDLTLSRIQRIATTMQAESTRSLEEVEVLADLGGRHFETLRLLARSAITLSADNPTEFPDMKLPAGEVNVVVPNTEKAQKPPIEQEPATKHERVYYLANGMALAITDGELFIGEVDDNSQAKLRRHEFRKDPNQEMMIALVGKLLDNPDTEIPAAKLRSAHEGYQSRPARLSTDTRRLRKLLGGAFEMLGYSKSTRYILHTLEEAGNPSEPAKSSPAWQESNGQPEHIAYPEDDFSGEHIETKGQFDFNPELRLFRERFADPDDEPVVLSVGANQERAVRLIMEAAESDNHQVEINLMALKEEFQDNLNLNFTEVHTFLRSNIILPLENFSKALPSVELIHDQDGGITHIKMNGRVRV